MRLRLVLAVGLAFAALLSGCVSSGLQGSHETSTQCLGDSCTVCVDGACAPCERGDCEACLDGDCAQLDAAAEAIDQPQADTSVHETIDLTGGMDARTWTIPVARNGTGSLRVEVHDLASKQLTVSAAVCHEYSAWGPWGSQSNRQTGCNGGNLASVSGTTMDRPKVILEKGVRPGTIVIKLWADPSPNELVIDFEVDNP